MQYEQEMVLIYRIFHLISLISDAAVSRVSIPSQSMITATHTPFLMQLQLLLLLTEHHFLLTNARKDTKTPSV